MDASQCQFFCNKPFWLTHHQKTKKKQKKQKKNFKLWKLPKVEGSISKCGHPFLCPLLQVSRE
jgi:hypothetical protein